MAEPSQRMVLLATLLVVSLTFSGCLTLNPSATPETNNSTVFERLAVDEPWAGQQIRATATLASSPAAGNVTQITVINENGKTFSSTMVDPGQTTVLLELPTNQNATLVASDNINGTTIEKLNVTTSGDTIG